MAQMLAKKKKNCMAQKFNWNAFITYKTIWFNFKYEFIKFNLWLMKLYGVIWNIPYTISFKIKLPLLYAKYLMLTVLETVREITMYSIISRFVEFMR